MLSLQPLGVFWYRSVLKSSSVLKHHRHLNPQNNTIVAGTLMVLVFTDEDDLTGYGEVVEVFVPPAPQPGIFRSKRGITHVPSSIC